jgi:hypothetical protein
MKVIVTAKELGESFEKAHRSLWNDKDVGINVKDQVAFWRDRFHATVSGGHFDNVSDVEDDNPFSENEWNIEDATIEFDNEEHYVLFMLEWS